MSTQASIALEVVDYVLDGDTQYCDSHIFTVEVRLANYSGNQYVITRSLMSFFEFDALLRRTFPKSGIMSLPLPPPAQTLKRVDSTAKRPSVKISEPLDNIKAKLNSLTHYMELLLEMPEVLRSAALMNFLDFESKDGTLPDPAGMSLPDILLKEVLPTTKVVVNRVEVKFEVSSSDYLAWSFSTKNRDIGFSVTVNGVDLVAYQRYNSHEDCVADVVEVTQTGTAVLTWDNSYSRVWSKSLTYSCAIFSPDDIATATASIRLGVMYSKCRNSLRRCLLQQAATVAGGASTDAVPETELVSGLSLEQIRYSRLEREVEDMHAQKSVLEGELCRSRERISTLEERLRSERERCACAQEECIGLRNLLAGVTKEKDINSASLLTAEDEVERQKAALLRAEERCRLIKEESAKALQRVKEEGEARVLENVLLTDTTTRLRAEKKQLKTFCVNMRDALEEAKEACKAGVERERSLESRVLVAEEQLADIQPLKDQLEVLLRDLSSLQTSSQDMSSITAEQADLRNASFAAAAEILQKLNIAVESRGDLSPRMEARVLGAEASVNSNVDDSQPKSASIDDCGDKRSTSSRIKSKLRSSKFTAKMAAVASRATQGPIRRRSTEAGVKVLSGLKSAVSKIESSMDAAFNFLDVDGLLEDENDADMMWHKNGEYRKTTEKSCRS